jgi:hypothetical protein
MILNKKEKLKDLRDNLKLINDELNKLMEIDITDMKEEVVERFFLLRKRRTQINVEITEILGDDLPF